MTGKTVRAAVGRDLHLKQARIVLKLEGRQIDDDEQLYDCVLALQTLPPAAVKASGSTGLNRRKRTRGRMLLLLQS